MSNALDQLPTPQSRVEQYYDFLTGRSTDITTLPTPQSRIEEFLEFLCYNGGGNSGGGSSGLTQAQVSQLITQAIKSLDLRISTNDDALELVHGNDVLASIDYITDDEIDKFLDSLK